MCTSHGFAKEAIQLCETRARERDGVANDLVGHVTLGRLQRRGVMADVLR